MTKHTLLLQVLSSLIPAYTEWLNKVNAHNIIGWYHSHPSYGCWLSGIDVNTQERYQNNSDPFLAIVCDPVRSANLSIFLLLFRKN